MPFKDKLVNKEYQKKWARKNRTNIDRRRSKLKFKYGISLEEYNILLEKQDGRCAICGTLPPDNSYLAVDHDHETGRIRGLLCGSCNTGLGMFNDNLNLLEKAVRYLDPRSYSG